MKSRCSLKLGVLLSALLGIQAGADTHFVRTDGGHVSPFTSYANAATNIQDAVDQATASDVVLVSNGTYNTVAQIDITNSITVRSVHGPEVTIVNAGDNSRCFFVSNATAVLSGLTGSNGLHTTFAGGAGLHLADGTATNCHLVANHSNFGRGSGARITSGLIVDCDIFANTSGDGRPGGAGIYVVGGVVTNCRIFSNSALGTKHHGCGVYMTAGTVVDCIVSNNVMDSSADNRIGAGMYIAGGTAENCIIVDNDMFASTSGAGSPGVYMNNAGATLRNSFIARNYDRSGGEPDRPRGDHDSRYPRKLHDRVEQQSIDDWQRGNTDDWRHGPQLHRLQQRGDGHRQDRGNS